jgi:hypothetical protein
MTAMIFLRENVLLEKELTHNDIKPRLLGMSAVLKVLYSLQPDQGFMPWP